MSQPHAHMHDCTKEAILLFNRHTSKVVYTQRYQEKLTIVYALEKHGPIESRHIYGGNVQSIYLHAKHGRGVASGIATEAS